MWKEGSTASMRQLGLRHWLGPSEMTLALESHPSHCSLPPRTHSCHWAAAEVSLPQESCLEPPSPLCLDSVHCRGSNVSPLCTSMHLAASDGGLRDAWEDRPPLTRQAGKTMGAAKKEAPFLAGTVISICNPSCLGG